MHAGEVASTWHGPRLPLTTRMCQGTRAPVADMRQRRTLLECMPRRTVFRTLSYLSMPDVIQLLCADKRLRPFVYAPSFAPWRKRYLRLRHAERLYEQTLRAPTDDGACVAADQALVDAYNEAMTAMRLRSPPLHLSDASNVVALCASEALPPPHHAQRFLVPWMLGRCSASEALALFDHAQALELLYFLRVFFVLVRLARLSQPLSSSSTHYHQMFHVLDADCADTLDAFFAPPAEIPRAQQLTSEQERFVQYQGYVTLLTQTGKTRSLLAYAQRRPHQRFLYITFNAAAARDARQRFPPNVDCRTMHSVALQHVTLPDGQAVGPLRPRDVVRWLPQLPVGRSTKATAQARTNTLAPTTVALYVLRTLDRFMQSMDAQVREVHTPWHMAQTTDLSPRVVAEAAQAVWDMIGASHAPNGRRVPCPHDAYVKYLQLHPAPCVRLFREYNALLLDEAQDLSACQTSLLLGARGYCGVIVVGDVHQKIYGFRGGSALAFHARLYPPTATFQLTQSFRFGPQVAAVATKILRLKAPPPWHSEREHGPWPRPRLTGHGTDAVYGPGTPITQPHTRIYRTNALLAREMLWLASTLPSDASLYLKTSQTLTHTAMVDLLRDAHKLYHGQADAIPHASPLRDFAAWKELEEHVEAEEGGDGKLGVVLSLAEAIAAPDFLARLHGLEQQFVADENEASVILTTVHQAKGLEWDRVLVADDFSPALQARVWALRPQVAQVGAQDELNHMYVALTRARRELFLPPCVLQWLVASDGLFRYRFTSKCRGSVACRQCHARRVCLVQMCQPYAGTIRFDARIDTLGCLRCVRQQLADDEELEDFVRWIDMCGISTATGQLSASAAARMLRRCREAPPQKRARHAPTQEWASLGREMRAERYMDLVEQQPQRIEAWLALGATEVSVLR